MKRNFLVLLLCCLATIAWAEVPLERIAVVPREELSPLLLQQARRVLLPLSEYRELLEKARAEDPVSPPRPAQVTAFDVSIRLEDDLARVEATARLEGLTDGVHAISLPTDGVYWTSATLDGGLAELGGDPGGTLVAFFEGTGHKELQLSGTVPLARRQHLQVLSFKLPDAPVRVRLSAPGEIEVAEGAAVVERIHDVDNDETRFTLHPQGQTFTAAFRVNRLLRDSPRLVRAEISQRLDVSAYQEEVYARVHLFVNHQPMREVVLEIPTDLNLLSVEGAGVASWRIEEEDGVSVARVRLGEDTLGRLSLVARGVRPRPDLDAWTPPALGVRDADLVNTAGELRLHRDLRLRDLSYNQAQPISLRDGFRLFPATDAPSFAWLGEGEDAPVRAAFHRPDIRVAGVVNLRLTLREEELELEGDVVLVGRGGNLHDSGFFLPSEWLVREVSDDRNRPLAHEVFHGDDGTQRVQVTFAAPVPEGQTHTYRFTARRVPEGWLESGGRQRVELPEFSLRGADTFSGAVALEALGEIRLGEIEVDGLTPLDQNEKALLGLSTSEHAQAWRFEEPGFSLAVQPERRQPELLAENFTFLRVETDRVRVRYEWIVQVRRARARELTFSLPVTLPVTTNVQGEKGTVIEETSRETREGREHWTLRLGAGSPQNAHFSLEAEFPLELGEPFAPAFPRVEGVDIQSGYVVVEGAPELEISLENTPTAVDVGEVAEAVYLPGARVLGVFMYVSSPPETRLVASRHPLADMARVRARSLNLHSRLSTEGATLHQADFVVDNAPPFLIFVPPAGSRVWSARVDGASVEPRIGRAGETLVPVPAADPGAARVVRVLYETPAPGAGLRKRVRAEAPALRVHGENGETETLEVSLIRWRVAPPQGYRLADSRGTAVPDRGIPPAAPALATLGNLAWRVSGGMRSLDFRSTRVTGMRGGAVQELGGDMDGEDYAELLMSDIVSPARMPGRPASADPFEPPQPEEKAPRDGQMVSGYRSLSIEMDAEAEGIPFHHYGKDARLDIMLVQQNRFHSLAWAAALAVIAAGLFFLTKSGATQRRYVVGVLLGSTLLASLPVLHAYTLPLNAAFYAAFALIPVYLLSRGCQNIFRSLIPAALVALLVFPATGLRAETPPPPRPIPNDVLLQPKGSDEVFVHLDHLESLWNKIREREQQAKPVVPHLTWLGAESVAELGENDTMEITTTLKVRARETTSLPVVFGDVVLTRATVNGGEGVWISDFGFRISDSSQKSAIHNPQSEILLSPGDHTIVLHFQARVEERGEGRGMVARLPVAPGHRARFRVPGADTEVTFRSEPVPRVVRTREAGETMETAPGADGRVELVWRPAGAVRVGEGSLLVESLAVLDLRDDLSMLVWNLKASLRGEAVHHLDLRLPPDWRLGEVEAGNFRGWEPLADGHTRVHLTRPEDKEIDLVLRLYRSPSGGAEDVAWRETLLEIGVPGALRHNGRVLVRHLPRLSVRAEQSEGIQREELQAEAFAALSQTVRAPFGETTAYQAFRFHATGYNMRLAVERKLPSVEATWERILRIARREQVVETRCRVRVSDRPAHTLRFQIPADMEIDSVNAPGDFLWHAEPAGDHTLLSLFSGPGWMGGVDVLITGRVLSETGAEPFALPDMRLLDATRQTGQWVVQVDPFYDVNAEELSEASVVPVATTHRWLTAPQRPTSRLAIAFETADHSATLRLRRRATEIASNTFTNLRVTDRVIEETVLVEFRVSGAGAREFTFRVPAHLSDARLRAPLLRRHEVRPVDDEWVEFNVELQDEVMGQLLVLLEHDRVLRQEAQTVRVPRVLTGRPGIGFVTLENSGRDEVVVRDARGMEALTRQHNEWARAARTAANATHAYVSREAEASLAFETTRRARVETAGASIGLATVRMVMDDSGAYRARWTGQVDNRTEQFLVVNLPEGARLLGVTVAGEAVRPARDPAAPASQIRVPLVKTAAGELDVPVEIVYGGRIGGFAELRSRGFPFPATVNVAVELSQAELHLPRGRGFHRFDGTMRRVADETEYKASVLKYQADVVERLAETLVTGGEYERARARRNVAVLSGIVSKSVQLEDGRLGQSEAGRQALGNVRHAEAQIAKDIPQADLSFNRMVLNEVFEVQSNTWGHNQVLRNPGNFQPVEAPATAGERMQVRQQVQTDYANLRAQNVAFRGRADVDLPAQRRDEMVQTRGQAELTEAYSQRLVEAEADETERVARPADPLAGLMPEPDPSLTRVYRFTTPRGDMRVTAWTLSAKGQLALQRLGSFGMVLAATSVLLLRRRAINPKPLRAYAPVWMFLGLLMIFTGIMSLLGLFLFFYAIYGFVRKAAAR